MKKRTMTIIQVLLVIVIIFSGVKIYSYSQNLKETDRIEARSRELLEAAKLAEEKALQEAKDKEIAAEKERQRKIQVSRDLILELQNEFPEAVGHIDIEDTRISYPVVQSKDNAFYLNHSPTTEWNPNGSIFLDYRNSIDFDDDNTIIYGHHIRTGKLFHNLHKFREQEFLNNVDIIEIHTNQGLKKFRVFSVYVTDPSFQYRHVNYPNTEMKHGFLQEILDRNIMETTYDEEALFEEDSKILTLSTCANSGVTRMVVHGIEIDE